MRVTITTLSDELYNLDVSADMELENLKALCEFESGIPTAELTLLWNGQPLEHRQRTLKQYGISDGDILLLQRTTRTTPGAGTPQSTATTAPVPRPNTGLPFIDFGGIAVPGGSGSGGGGVAGSSGNGGAGGWPDDPATLRQMLLASPHDVAILKERNPPLAESLSSLEKFTEVLRKQQQEKSERERERLRLITANPFDPDIQEKIAEEIRLKNVESNMETAMEFSPESFGQVVMLYIDCRVNGHAVKAFVDSGAQMTIMSQACAERCNIMRLVDRRWAGIAKGVGTQKIIGRVHLCQIQIGDDFLQSSFSILEEQPMDMLLGLDMLKRHQCCLDLKRNKLVIGTTQNETSFLAEVDLPPHARLNQALLGAESTTAGGDDDDRDEQLQRALASSALAQDNNAKRKK